MAVTLDFDPKNAGEKAPATNSKANKNIEHPAVNPF